MSVCRVCKPCFPGETLNRTTSLRMTLEELQRDPQAFRRQTVSDGTRHALPDPARPPRRALRTLARSHGTSGFGTRPVTPLSNQSDCPVDFVFLRFPDMPCMKRVYRDK